MSDSEKLAKQKKAEEEHFLYCLSRLKQNNIAKTDET